MIVMTVRDEHFWRRRGQTLIEAMMALSVITISFMGIAVLFSKSFYYNRVVSDQLTATYLASEGVELAKSFIDRDAYAGQWGNCFNGQTEYYIDYTMTTCPETREYPVVVGSPLPLNLDSVTHMYSYNVSANSSPTNFSRIIQIVPNDIGVAQDPDEITVNSIVTWSTGEFTSQSINLEDHFYFWRKKS